MKYRRLGTSGLQVSELSFGAWVTFAQQITEKTAEKLMTIAYDSGVNFFDNAEAYANGKAEMVMGRILKRRGWARDTFLVSSKVFWGGDLPNQEGLSRKHVMEACHAALRRLRVDYLDLYFCHRPDPNTPIEETVRAMSDLVAQGKVLYWGTSEWSAKEIAEAHRIARKLLLAPPTMEQPQYNMFHRERVEKEFASLYPRVGLGTTIWSPLASGLLTGKYNEGDPGGTRISLKEYDWLREQFENDEARERLAKVKKLAKVAADLGTTLPRLGLAWCLKNPHVSSVITGASKPKQVKENMKAGELVDQLTDQVMRKIEAILRNKPGA
ncbi:MAG TPA: aldo/keto reductase [Chthoniobacterales bacterium]|nr:aldo/keto reductase [Chthoniobacterales bacterium]